MRMKEDKEREIDGWMDKLMDERRREEQIMKGEKMDGQMENECIDSCVEV